MAESEGSLHKNVRKVMNVLPMVNLEPPHDYRWEELRTIEAKRREILQRVEEPFWKTLLYWSGTVLPSIFTDALFWITLAIYIATRLGARRGLPDFVAQLGESDHITVLGGFLSFFLVFYANQNHQRYFSLYRDSMSCKGRIFDTATLAVTTMSKTRATRLVRYMNAAHASGYVGLSKIYPSDSYFKHVNKELGLLTEDELARMNEIDLDEGGACNRELIAWCMMEVQTGVAEDRLDKELANLFRLQILELRGKIGQLYNAADLPIPFFYVHFICLLTVLYLPLFAVTAGVKAGTGQDTSHWFIGLVTGFVVMLQAIFVIGLRLLGQKMSDPYGDDLIDLSVMHYVQFTWIMSNRILKTHFPGDAKADTEESIIEKRKTLGAAWEPDDKASKKTASDSYDSSVSFMESQKKNTAADGSVPPTVYA